MPDPLANSLPNCGAPASQYPTTWWVGVLAQDVKFILPAGALRIGGDSPDGLVLSGGAPAARTVRLYDMATGELVAETTSSGAGTYAFTGLSARDDGYGVWIVGNATERGVVIPGVDPGA